MKLISQGAQYSVSAIIALARHPENTAVSASELAKSLNCPAAYLSQLLSKLKPAGIIKSLRGLNGGVYLGKSLSEITLMDVITAIDGREFFEQCFLGINGCGHIEPCPFHTFWSAEREKIKVWLEKTTFKDVNESLTENWFDMWLQFNK